MTPPPPAPSRLLTWAAAAALAAVLVVNVPPFLRTALDCDPILFDLYARDMARGGVLYRDMLENNPPGMIALHAAVRAAFGPSTEALRAVDLVVVGAAVGLLGWWSHRGRIDLRLLTVALLAALYLTTTEWCHVQRDVWQLLPVMAALYLRRGQAVRLAEGRGSFARAALEGVVWGLAVWIKPHVVLVGLPVWVASAAWARGGGAAWRRVAADAAGLLLGGAAVGAAGVGAMAALGIWWPYVDHLRGWGGQYAAADLCYPSTRWEVRLVLVIRNAPWSVVYLLMWPVAIGMLGAGLVRRGGDRSAAGLGRLLLAAALAGWGFQAWALQHEFDYVHVPGMMLALALLADLAGRLSASGLHRAVLAGLVALAALAHGPVFRDRLGVWAECVRPDPPPELRDRLARYERIGWADLHRTAEFLRGQDARAGEVAVVSDSALPLWELTGQTPPVRYYIVVNNLMAFPDRRGEIFAALAAVPGQRFVVCDVMMFYSAVPPGCDWRNGAAWPIPPDWYGERRWADRIVFRAGRYVVLEMPAADVPAWMADVTGL